VLIRGFIALFRLWRGLLVIARWCRRRMYSVEFWDVIFFVRGLISADAIAFRDIPKKSFQSAARIYKAHREFDCEVAGLFCAALDGQKRLESLVYWRFPHGCEDALSASCQSSKRCF